MDTDTEESIGNSQSNHGSSAGMVEDMANLSLTPGPSAANVTYQQPPEELEGGRPQDTYADDMRAVEKDQDHSTKNQDLSSASVNIEIPRPYSYDDGVEPTFECVCIATFLPGLYVTNNDIKCQCGNGPFMVSLYPACISCHHGRCVTCRVEDIVEY